jgi:SSS family solute:Na+ symporter
MQTYELRIDCNRRLFFGALVSVLLAKDGIRIDMQGVGRGFGTLITFVLIAGKAFSIFSFLGATGWAYGRCTPTSYYLACASLAFVIGYWTLPPLQAYAQEKGLNSSAFTCHCTTSAATKW